MIRNAQDSKSGEVVWEGLSVEVKFGGKKKKKSRGGLKEKSQLLQGLSEEKGERAAGAEALGLELPVWEPETKPLWLVLRAQENKGGPQRPSACRAFGPG